MNGLIAQSAIFLFPVIGAAKITVAVIPEGRYASQCHMAGTWCRNRHALKAWSTGPSSVVAARNSC